MNKWRVDTETLDVHMTVGKLRLRCVRQGFVNYPSPGWIPKVEVSSGFMFPWVLREGVRRRSLVAAKKEAVAIAREIMQDFRDGSEIVDKKLDKVEI